MMEHPTVLLDVRDLGITFTSRGRSVPVVTGLSYRLEAGKVLAIVGESGAGKTVACRALLGLLPPHASITGSAKFAATELIGLGEHALRRLRGAGLGIAFQDSGSALNPVRRIGDQIVDALRAHRRLDRRAARECAIDLLRDLRLPHPEHQYDAYPHQMSGGMRHRVVLAIALAGAPSVLIADETTKSLDPATAAEVLTLLEQRLRQRGMAMVFVTHDLRLAARIADEVIVMQSGRIAEQGPAHQVLRQPASAYTRRLIEAMPCCGSEPSAELIAPAEPKPPVLEVRNLGQRYRRRSPPILAEVSFTIDQGEAFGLIGESGSGKSTLARSLVRFAPWVTGSVTLLGRELSRLDRRALRTARRGVQMVFQDPLASLNPTWRIGAIVEEPLRGYRLGDSMARRRKVDELLDRVGLPAEIYRDRRPHELSGGQCQRVAIARALAPDPALLICDEAVSSLDVLIQKQIIDLLTELRTRSGVSILFISHDLPLVARFCDRVAVLHRGRLCEIGPVERLLQRPSHPQTASLLAPLTAGALSNA